MFLFNFGHLWSPSGYGNFEHGLVRVEVATVYDIDLAGVTHLLVSGVANLDNSQFKFRQSSCMVYKREESVFLVLFNDNNEQTMFPE